MGKGEVHDNFKAEIVIDDYDKGLVMILLLLGATAAVLGKEALPPMLVNFTLVSAWLVCTYI